MKIGKHYKGGLWNILDPLGFFDFKNFGKGPIDLINNALGKYAGTGLTDADKEANDFTAKEAQKQRDWESSEAEIAYERQREFYQDFQSPQAQIQQYQEAGLNPALMYGNGAGVASPISAPQGSGGAAAQSVKPDSGDLAQLISLMANIGFRKKELDAEVKLKGAQTNYYDALATGQGNENDTFFDKFELWKQTQNKNLAEIDSRIFLNSADAELKRQNISESEARTTLLHYQGLVARSEAKYADKLNESLLSLRSSAEELNKANAEYARNGSAESKQRLTEAQQSWGTRWRTLQETLRQVSASSGISEKEFEAFWSDKRLNELLVLSEIYDNYKNQMNFFGAGGSHSDWTQKTIDSGLPSLYPIR